MRTEVVYMTVCDLPGSLLLLAKEEREGLRGKFKDADEAYVFAENAGLTPVQCKQFAKSIFPDLKKLKVKK